MDKTLLGTLIRRLPEKPGIMGKERYFNSAVLVPLLTVDGSYHLLFEKRAENIRQGSEICFPGGMHETGKDRDCRATAIRETVEELGVSREKIRILGRFDTLVATIGATVDAFLGEISIRSLSEISFNPQEVEKVFTMPVDFFLSNAPETYQIRLVVEPEYTNRKGEDVVLLPARKLGLPERYHQPWGKSRHEILVYKTDYGVIWGITAAIIHDMVMKLKNDNAYQET